MRGNKCDVPEHLRDHFQEMCPICKNVEISRDDIGDYMKTYAEENDIMKQPRRSLIGSMIGEKILLATPLLRWYLEHGLEVSFKYCELVKFQHKVFQQIILFCLGNTYIPNNRV